jgi:hypothetical protein
MRRRLLVVVVVGLFIAIVGIAGQRKRTSAQPPAKADKVLKPPAPALPIAQVILFSSGVGYFQRQGDVEGNARVDLSFPQTDVNDLLKSLVLQDAGGGQVGMISYDSHDPIDKTLKSFALDLTANPTFGQLLNQARGERIEVVTQAAGNLPAAMVTGTIVGMESQRQQRGSDIIEVDQLNLLTADGMRGVPLAQVQRVRFLNASLDAELKRALEVLALGHDSQKKSVTLNFTGDGKRAVRVGYVVESPIWKTSYRLVLDKEGKPFLQGWAVVENSGDDDWNQVRMVLVSGRPISYQMDLYEPLYVPRPMVEPELFASLRPPTYGGALVAGGQIGVGGGNAGVAGIGGIGGLGGFAGLGGGQANLGNLGGATWPGKDADEGVARDPMRGRFFGGLGLLGGNRYQGAGQAGLQGGQAGQQGGQAGRLTYEELQRRRQERSAAKDTAKKVGSAVAALDPREGVPSFASGTESGDYFQYAIDQPVTLPRQKSALLPIMNQPVAATRVSIFNQEVHATFPLLGLKFKNTSGQHLMQGPLTVYEDGRYAGDARLLDLQPDEERLISYAIDLGTEVKASAKPATEQLVAVTIAKGILRATTKWQNVTTYMAKNRSRHERNLLIEHPIKAGWKLVAPAKPMERSRDVYRFQLAAPAGQTVRQEVIEERSGLNETAVSSCDEKTFQLYIAGNAVSPRVKAALKKAVEWEYALADSRRLVAQVTHQLKELTDDQARLRANFRELPATSAAYKRYLTKFDTQETEIETLQKELKQATETEKRQQKEYGDYLVDLNVE